MTQQRYLEYLTDPNTTILNHWLLGMLQPGLYRGFDFSVTSNMNLTLSHASSGITEVNDAGNYNNPKGVLLTKSGFVIKEDANIVVALIGNSSGSTRIDAIVCNHTRIATTGGAAATYSAIQGTPGAGYPALTFPKTQTLLGYVILPDGTGHLNDAGVVYEKSAAPFFANHLDNFAYDDRDQTFGFRQEFKRLALSEWNPITMQTGNVLLTTYANTLQGNILFEYTPTVTAYVGGMTARGNGDLIILRFKGETFLYDFDLDADPIRNISAPFGNRKFDAEDVGMFIGRTDPDTEAYYWELVSVLKGNGAVWYKGAAATFDHDDKTIDFAGGNFFDVAIGTEDVNEVSWIRSRNNPGTIIELQLDNYCTLTNPGAVSPPSAGDGLPFKPVWTTDDLISMRALKNQIVTVIEDTNYYRVLSLGGFNLRDALLEEITLGNSYVYATTGAGDKVCELTTQYGNYVKLKNGFSANQIILKKIKIQPWHYKGYEIIIEMSNQAGGSKRMSIENWNTATAGNGNISVGQQKQVLGDGSESRVFNTGTVVGSSAPKIFAIFKLDGTLWNCIGRSVNY